MKIVYNRLIPFPGFTAMNLFGVLFARSEYKDLISERTINHESIHTAQMKEMLYVFFYIWYFIEWLIRLIFNTSTAYRSISFEQEAYNNQLDFNYLKTRKKYSWLKHLKTRYPSIRQKQKQLNQLNK